MARQLTAALCVLAVAVAVAVAVGAGSASAATVPVSTGHSQWAWGAPTPQGQDLAAIAFSGPDGYAVGTFGTILRTQDAGQTWSGLASGTTGDLSLVQEISPTTVIAAGGCSAVESTDSGASFEPLALGPADAGRCGEPVAGIAFSDAEHGYLELRDGTVMYTADAGATVQTRTSVPVGGGDATGLAFSSPADGLAVTDGGLIERTTDGGNSWTRVEAAPHGLNAVTVISPALAYAVGDAGLLLESTDGGATWTTLPLALPDAAAPPDLTSITCVGAGNCLITTATSGELLRTTDGGQTAAVVTASDAALTAVAYSTGTTVVGVGALGATAVSQDGGQTFSVISADGLSGAVPNGTLTAGPDPGSAYVTEGLSDAVAMTTDAGRSWTLEHVPGAAVMSAAYSSDTDGFVLGEDGVLRQTTNAGVSWSAIGPAHSSLARLVAPSPQTLLFVGPRGISISTDGGSSSHPVGGRLRVRGRLGPPVASLRLNDAFAVHGTVVAYQGGSAGSIIVSTDGGRRWRAIPPPPHPAHTAIDVTATSASRLWVYANSNLWTTSDGGRHWRTLPALGRWLTSNRPSEPYSGSLSFSSPSDGIVMADGPRGDQPTFSQVSVLRTSDGGRTWTPEMIAGNELDTEQSVLATPRGDLAQLDTAGSLVATSRPLGFFTTAGTAAPSVHTTLRVGFVHRTMTARALARAGHRVLVTGRVRPVLSRTEQVAVSTQVDDRRWTMRAVPVAADGSFRLTLTGVDARARVVAQVVGTSTASGAGTPVARFSVRR